MDELMIFYKKDLSFLKILYKDRETTLKIESLILLILMLCFVFSGFYSIVHLYTQSQSGVFPLIVSIMMFFFVKVRIDLAFELYANRNDIKYDDKKQMENKVRENIRADKLERFRLYFEKNEVDMKTQAKLKKQLRKAQKAKFVFPVLPTFLGAVILSLTDKYFGYIFELVSNSSNGGFYNAPIE